MGDSTAVIIKLKDIFSYRNVVHAVAGATGSSVAMTTFYPLEVARTRLQVDDHRKAEYSIVVIKDIFEEEGITGLYRGWFPVVTSICCSNFVYFYTFNCLKAIAYKGKSKPYPAKDLLLGFLAGVTNVLLTTPLWVANTRLKLQGIKWTDSGDANSKSSKPSRSILANTNYTGMFDALYNIMRREGVLGLWSGTLPSLVLTLNPAVQFMVYEALKRKALRLSSHNKQELSALTYFMMGALAKVAATFVTYPLQVIQSKLRAGLGQDGAIKCIKDLIRCQGWLGMYKGLEAKLTQTVAMAALMFVTYEKIAALVFRLMRQQLAKKPV